MRDENVIIRFKFKHYLVEHGYKLNTSICDYESVLIALNNDPVFNNDLDLAFANWLESSIKFYPDTIIKL